MAQDNNETMKTEKLDSIQKRKVENLIKEDKLCDLVVYLSSINEERNADTLKHTYDYAKRFFWKKMKKKQRRNLQDIMATAHMLYLDLDRAAEHFIESENDIGLQQVLNLGMLYGRYDAVNAVCEYGTMQGKEELMLNREDYDSFLVNKVIPNIQLERDGDDFFLREDILDGCLGQLNVDATEALGPIVKKMKEVGSYDTARKLLLSMYSGDKTLIKETKEEFNAKSGKRKNIDALVEDICKEHGFKLEKKIQQGDEDDYYPLSANLYLVSKDGIDFVLKENIRYRIDFSCLEGFNMESELYTEFEFPGFPQFFGTFKSNGPEMVLMECVKGEQLTKYTDPENLLEKEKTLDVVRQLSRSLKYLHSRDIVYADMKDKNVMYDGTTAKVLDFGMASNRLYKEESTGEEYVHEVTSNAEYACPETIMMSRVYKKSDIFQLGIVFYKLLTGNHPFADGKATENYTERESELVAFSLPNLWNRVNYDYPVFRENTDIKTLVRKMLDKNYKRRPNADTVIYELSMMLGDNGTNPHEDEVSIDTKTYNPARSPDKDHMRPDAKPSKEYVQPGKGYASPSKKAIRIDIVSEDDTQQETIEEQEAMPEVNANRYAPGDIAESLSGNITPGNETAPVNGDYDVISSIKQGTPRLIKPNTPQRTQARQLAGRGHISSAKTYYTYDPSRKRLIEVTRK